MRDGSATVSFEQDTNRAGGDFTSFEAIGERLEICRDACAAESSCVAYTYVRSGLQGPRAMCWLKSSVPEPRMEGCCISGSQALTTRAISAARGLVGARGRLQSSGDQPLGDLPLMANSRTGPPSKALREISR